MSTSRKLAAAIAALGVAVLPGCVAAGIGGTTYAVKASQRGDLQGPARAGDAQAQYELGLSHCCMGPGFSTRTATEWLCQAAKQGYAPAQYELGRIYAGEVSRTPAPGQKVIRAATAKSDSVSSYVWFQLAADGGEDRAVSRASDALSSLTEYEVMAAESSLANWRDMPCEYDDVFSD
ncbi:MAG: hypothetical protein AAGK02_11970 [Pseudomonadota bacterium]